MNRILVIFLLIGASSALKGQQSRLRRVVEEGDIVQENGLPKAEKVEKVEKIPIVKIVKDPKEKKEKKVKTCKKVPKAVTPPTSDGSATTSQLTLPAFLGGGDDVEEDATTTVESPTITTNSSLPSPPPPPPDVENQDGLTTPLPPGPEGPAATSGEDTGVMTGEEDLPWCPAVGKKARSEAYCASLLAGTYPDHKSVKGEVQFDVMYDENEPAVLEGVKDKIKKKAARKAAGCKDNRRNRRRVQESDAATTTPPPPPMENIYISGVKFGDFDVTDKCDSHDSMDGCDKVIADVEILYEAPDNRDVTEEEAELLFMEVMQSIQLEGFEGAVVDNLSAQVQGSNRRVSGGKAGAIAGGTLAAAAVVAGVAVYKRYGNDIAAKWG